jgi:hypothetical protein
LGGQFSQLYLRFIVTNILGVPNVLHLFRFPELLFQIFDQLQEALCGDGIVDQGGRPLGLFQPPL